MNGRSVGNSSRPVEAPEAGGFACRVPSVRGLSVTREWLFRQSAEALLLGAAQQMRASAWRSARKRHGSRLPSLPTACRAHFAPCFTRMTSDSGKPVAGTTGTLPRPAQICPAADPFIPARGSQLSTDPTVQSGESTRG